MPPARAHVGIWSNLSRLPSHFFHHRKPQRAVRGRRSLRVATLVGRRRQIWAADKTARERSLAQPHPRLTERNWRFHFGPCNLDRWVCLQGRLSQLFSFFSFSVPSPSSHVRAPPTHAVLALCWLCGDSGAAASARTVLIAILAHRVGERPRVRLRSREALVSSGCTGRRIAQPQAVRRTCAGSAVKCGPQFNPKPCDQPLCAPPPLDRLC